jgi:hypothetical protein
MKHLMPHARERKVKIKDAIAKSTVMFLVDIWARWLFPKSTTIREIRYAIMAKWQTCLRQQGWKRERMGVFLTIANIISGLCSLRIKYTPKTITTVRAGGIDMVKPNSGSMKWTSIKPYCKTKQTIKKAPSLTKTT